MRFSRILLKLSGEALIGKQQYGIDPDRLKQYTKEIKQALDIDVQVGVVIGGGNIFRGLSGLQKGFSRIQGDYMGMLATVINSLALQSALKEEGISSRLFSGIAIDSVAELMSSQKAINSLEAGQVVIMAGGTGNPYFTTDTAAALRAVEIKANAVFKGTRVDGVYSDDPEKYPDATRYDVITFDEAIDKDLKIMDLTAFTLCRENNLPIIVFNMNTPGNLIKILKGKKTGTIVTNK